MQEEISMEEKEKKKGKRFLVQLSTGKGDVGRVKSALMFATLARMSDLDTVLYCVQDGSDALIKGKIREEGNLPDGLPTFEQRLAEAMSAGVRFELCGEVARNRNLKKEDLIDGAEIVGGINLITYALEYDGMLSF